MFKKITKGIGVLFMVLFISGFAEATALKETLVKSDEELRAAIQRAVPGDRIVMQNGDWKDVNILFKGAGTQEKPITLKAQTAGQVILSGKSSLRLSGEYLVVDGLHFKDGYSTLGHVIQFRDGREHASHSRITNMVISKFNLPDPEGYETWVGLFGINNRVDHSFFHDKISAGRIITVWRPTDVENRHQIDRNYFKDVPVLGKNGAEAIGVGGSKTSLSDSYTTIEYNLFENCNGEGELIGLKSGQNIVRYNTIVTSQGSISVRHGNHNLVEGNFIFGDHQDNIGGIRVMGEGHIIKNNYIQGLRGRRRPALSLIEGVENSPLHGSYQVKNVVIEGNTLIDNDLNIVIGERYDPSRKQIMPVLNSILKNNVVLGSSEKNHLIEFRDQPQNMIYEGNVMYRGILELSDPGVRIENPPLKPGKDGIYRYEHDSPLKNNVVGQPLKRSEVGPEWIKTRWEELGIREIPYVNFSVNNQFLFIFVTQINS